MVDYAQSHNFTHIIVVKTPGVRWIELLRGSVTERLIRRAGGVNIHVIAPPSEPPRPREGAPARGTTPDIRAYFGSAGFVALAVLSGLVLRETLAVSNISLAFLTAVLASAVTFGLWPSLFASLISALAYNFFFLEPLYTFTVSDPENVVSLFFFAVVAFIASNLAARVRTQGDRRAAAGADHRGTVSVQPQAGRRRHAR